MTLLRRIWAELADIIDWHLHNPPEGIGVIQRPRKNLKPEESKRAVKTSEEYGSAILVALRNWENTKVPQYSPCLFSPENSIAVEEAIARVEYNSNCQLSMVWHDDWVVVLDALRRTQKEADSLQKKWCDLVLEVERLELMLKDSTTHPKTLPSSK